MKKLCFRHKRFAAQRVNQAAESRQRAADAFRQRHIDAALKKALTTDPTPWAGVLLSHLGQ